MDSKTQLTSGTFGRSNCPGAPTVIIGGANGSPRCLRALRDPMSRISLPIMDVMADSIASFQRDDTRSAPLCSSMYSMSNSLLVALSVAIPSLIDPRDPRGCSSKGCEFVSHMSRILQFFWINVVQSHHENQPFFSFRLSDHQRTIDGKNGKPPQNEAHTCKRRT